MALKFERRRNPDVPRPHGERWTDRLLASRRSRDVTADERVWLWGAKLWFAAAVAGTVYGIGWLNGLL